MKIALEYDDFSPRNSSFGLLEALHERYPKFKVTMFTVAFDIRFGSPTPITQPEFKPFVDAVKKCNDWIEIAVHGLSHIPMEFSEISYDEAVKRVIIAEKMFENQGIKYAKIFKAPHWALSLEGERALVDRGYHVVKDGYYQWNLADDMPLDLPKDQVIITHGHIQNVCGNGLEETYMKVAQLNPDTEFFFLSEVLLNKNG